MIPGRTGSRLYKYLKVQSGQKGKNMKKNKAIIILVVMVLALIGITCMDIWGIDGKGKGSASEIKLGLDLAGGVSITYQVAGDEEPSATDMSDTISKLQQRVWNYSTEANVYQEGTNRINIEIPGVTDANEILKDLGRPGSLYFITETDDSGNSNYSYQTAYDEKGELAYAYALNKTIEELEADGSIVLVGTDVKDAQAGSTTNSMGNQEYAVNLTMTEEGTIKFAEATQRAYAKRETIGIYYDGEFVSVPRVNVVISDGAAQIIGMGAYAEAERLASTIRIGGLKLELEELHSKVVGAQLGVEAIDTSLKAGAIGIVIIIIFMIAVYFIPGVASVIGLLLYVALIVLLLRGFEMTLTLSGIAGIILSIGMAVDANVIIFARIREELASGKTVRTAIKIGFDKALSAIVDGNITTLLVAGVLLVLGPGTVKGFAQTLALGIVLSMFTALVITKTVINAFYAIGFKDAKWYGVAKERKTMDFLSKKGIFIGLSAVLIAAGLAVMVGYNATTGDMLNFSLEFKGGTSTNVTFHENMSLEEVNDKVIPLMEEVTGEAVQIQTVEGTNEVIFKTNSLDMDTREALTRMFLENFGVDEQMITTETISSTISDEMTTNTLLAVAVAIVLMLIYIRLRFRDIRFGFSSVIALIHDVLIVVVFYGVARVSVGNTFIACILTIVGYSINATIVIFDRVRENMVNVPTAKLADKEILKEIVNRSITQTLSRSIFTSLTTFIMVAVLYILGVTSIRDFALPLMVGIVAGAYSSVCLTGAVWYMLRMKFPPKTDAK